MPFLNVIKQFMNSEKAVAAGVLVAVSTVFVFLDKITVAQWMSYTQVLLGIYVGGKAIQGAAAAVSGGQAEAAQAKAELIKMRAALDNNDAAADAALADKFEDSADSADSSDE